MKKIIKYTGNTDRFAGQRTAILLRAELQIVKEMSDELKRHVGNDAIPRGSAILCTYIGDKGIAFSELINYGCHALSRLKKMIGQSFSIDVSPNEQQESMEEKLI